MKYKKTFCAGGFPDCAFNCIIAGWIFVPSMIQL
jgi:hypothetical protein